MFGDHDAVNIGDVFDLTSKHEVIYEVIEITTTAHGVQRCLLRAVRDRWDTGKNQQGHIYRYRYAATLLTLWRRLGPLELLALQGEQDGE